MLLVLLEKEQGLVTDTWPTSRQYRSATGYGCPDTADCDTTYYGFYNQVYNAAWQFRKYRAYPSIRAYQAGRYNTILWHPNQACGSSSVYIRNQATAGLYSYTPYRPNAAALANLYGTGDGCSSYGNRNFWRIFTDWFGSTLESDGTFAIAAAYQAAGGSAVLGTQTTASPCAVSATTCWVHYTKGVIHWTSKRGAIVVSGAVAAKYLGRGGVTGSMGPPTAHAVRVTENGGGVAQAFANGIINAGPNGAFVTSGVFRPAHAELGGVRGTYGWPTADATCTLPGGGCSQKYQGGTLYAKNGVRAWGLRTAIDTWYGSQGGPGGALGWPTSNSVRVTENGGGDAAAFEQGLLNWGPAGPFVTRGGVRSVYAAVGGVRGEFGWPIAAQACTLPGGGCSQPLQGGTIYVDSSGQGQGVVRKIDTLYKSLGGPTGDLGRPISASVRVTENGGGYAQAFERGLVNAGPAGPFVMAGAIRTEHAALGGVRGPVGWPNSPAVAVSENGGGQAQSFQNGLINAGPSGAFLVQGDIREEHTSLGGVRGVFGWPTGARVCNLPGSGCMQPFQRGTIYDESTRSALGVIGVIDAKYRRLGGPAGSLGWPRSASIAVLENGGGYAQAFANALINAGPGGAFVLSGAIRERHAELGGVRGSYGWPTGDQLCTTSKCSQPFQGGTITVSR